jgi:hypothetical protein
MMRRVHPSRRAAWLGFSPVACPAIRSPVGWALIIPLIIQTIGLDPSEAIWSDEASNLSRPDPSEADQADAEHPTR